MSNHTRQNSKLLQIASEDTMHVDTIAEILKSYPENEWVNPKDNPDPRHYTAFCMLSNLGLVCKMEMPAWIKGQHVGKGYYYLYNHAVDFSALKYPAPKTITSQRPTVTRADGRKVPVYVPVKGEE
jgi:hypothetical protein